MDYKVLNRLKNSKFRSNFILNEKDLKYIKKLGYSKIREHALDFIIKRIAPKEPLNDGKQTPMKGHPVFIAQHATATCCRNCIYKWHKISKNKELSKQEIIYLVNIIMKWIEENSKT